MIGKSVRLATSLAVGIAMAGTSFVSGQDNNPPPKPERPRQPAVQPQQPQQPQPQQQAEPQPQPGVQVQPGAQQSAAPAQAYRAKQVLGSKVSIQGNVSIGTVDDLVFDDNGQVEYLIVENEGNMVTVPWEAAKFNFQQRTATVNINQQQFQKIPTYTGDQYPAYFTTPYRTQVYGFYGLTPRVQRRLNRL